jgi:hypothetical protein
VISGHGVLSHGVLPWTSSTAPYNRFSRLSGCFEGSHFVSFVVARAFGSKVGFYRRYTEASWSAREL